MTRKNNENNKSRKMIRRLAVAGLATAVAVSLMPATALAAGGPEPGHDYYREEPMYGFMPEEHHGGGWYGEPHYGYYYDDFGRGCWCWYYPGMYGQPGWYDFGHGVYHDDHMGHGGHDDHDNGSWDQQIGGESGDNEEPADDTVIEDTDDEELAADTDSENTDNNEEEPEEAAAGTDSENTDNEEEPEAPVAGTDSENTDNEEEFEETADDTVTEDTDDEELAIDNNEEPEAPAADTETEIEDNDDAEEPAADTEAEIEDNDDTEEPAADTDTVIEDNDDEEEPAIEENYDTEESEEAAADTVIEDTDDEAEPAAEETDDTEESEEPVVTEMKETEESEAAAAIEVEKELETVEDDMVPEAAAEMKADEEPEADAQNETDKAFETVSDNGSDDENEEGSIPAAVIAEISDDNGNGSTDTQAPAQESIETEEVIDSIVPLAEAEAEKPQTENAVQTAELSVLADEEIPMALSSTTGGWAAVNMALMAGTVLAGLGMIFTFLKKRGDKMMLLGIIPAAAAVTAFILTEDMTQTMQMTDRWTALMAIILAGSAAVILAVNLKAVIKETEA